MAGDVGRVSQLLNKYGWDIEYFKGFILGLEWLGLYRENSRFEAFLDIEAGCLNSQEHALLERYANKIIQDIHLEKYRFSAGCQVQEKSLKANYSKKSKLFQWASGIYMACRIIEVMIDDGDLDFSSMNTLLMDRIAESIFPFVDQDFAKKFFSEINSAHISSSECLNLLIRLRKDIPKIIRDITVISQTIQDEPLDRDDYQDGATSFEGPIKNIHGYLAGITDPFAINETLDRLLPAVMSGDRQRRVKQLETMLEYAENALGKDFFIDNEGMFWGLFETRCYMRILTALAEVYRSILQREKAVYCYEKSLKLCHMDNLGARYLLAELYLELMRVDDAIALVKRFEFDDSAMMNFTLLIAKYAKFGQSKQVLATLKKAWSSNPFIIEMLLGVIPMPQVLPDFYESGSEEEAAIYVSKNRLLWRNTPSLMTWLDSVYLQLKKV